MLWDLDGTLVDTEPSWIAAEYRLVESFGGSWNDAHAHALVGNPLLVSAAYLREHGGVELPLAEIVDRLLAEVVAAVEREVIWRPGVRRLLAELRAAERAVRDGDDVLPVLGAVGRRTSCRPGPSPPW